MKKIKVKDFLKIYTAIVVVLGIVLIGLLSSCSSCKAGYCDAYGANDVTVETDRV